MMFVVYVYLSGVEWMSVRIGRSDVSESSGCVYTYAVGMCVRCARAPLAHTRTHKQNQDHTRHFGYVSIVFIFMYTTACVFGRNGVAKGCAD